MKVVHFTNNTIDGAGQATYRIHKALLAKGIDSKMLVLNKNFNDDSVIEIKPKTKVAPNFDFLRLYANKFYRRVMFNKVKPNTLFNFNMPSIGFKDIKEHLGNVQVICLHSVQYFLSPEVISEIYKNTNSPLVWTLMDIEPLTGGCHFNSGCVRFERGCGNCPKLKRPKEDDLSRQNFDRKIKYLKGLPIFFVAGSSWVADHIKRSAIFQNNRIKNIFLSVDKTVYKEIDQQSARQALKLPLNKKIILFGCFNFNQERKGAKHLLEALIKMPENFPKDKKDTLKDILLLTFGDSDGFSFSKVPFEWKHIGLLKNKQELAYIYHSADVLAVPSLDDCGPLMVNEAFMSDLPVVAYNVGVSPDLIKSAQSGYIAKRYDIDDFCSGIIHCLLLNKNVRDDEVEKLKTRCTLQYQADQYLTFFEETLNSEKLNNKNNARIGFEEKVCS